MKRFLGIGLVAILALAGCSSPVDPALSSAADLTAVSLQVALNPQLDKDYAGTKNPLSGNFTFSALPTGTSVTALIPTFSASAGATVRVNGNIVTSSVSEVDFTNPVVFSVTAENGTTSKDFTVTVTAPELGFTSFSIEVSGLPDDTMPLTVDNDALTITGEVPYTFRTALDNPVVVNFAHNGTGVYEDVSLLTSGTSTLDFSPAGHASWSIELQNTAAIVKTYTVTVTAAASASTEAGLSEFSVTYGTETFPGTIAGTEVTLPRLPVYVDINALTVNFTMAHVAATLTDGAITLASGTDVLDLGADKTLTATAEDGTTTLSYTVRKPDNTPALAIVAFDSADDADNLKWIEVKVIDKTRVTGVARLVATGQYENVLIPDFTALPIWANVVDGDVIRIWDAYALKTSDTVKSDNSPAVWDQLNLEAGKYNLGEKYGALVLDIGGTPINYVAYSVDANTSWTVKASMTVAVTAKLWPSTARDTAYNPVTYTAGCYYQLAAGFTHGVSAAAWERATGQEFWTLSGAAASLQVNAGTGGDVTFSVTPVYTGTGTHGMTSIALDVTPLDNTLADPNLVMTDPDVDGTYTLDFTVPSSITAGYKSLRFRTETVVDGVTLLDTATTYGYTVLGAKDFSIDAVAVDNALILWGVATPVNFSVDVTPINIEAVDSVSMDLSALGGAADAALADANADDTWTLVYEIPATVAAGTYPVTVTVTVLGENGVADQVKTDASLSMVVTDQPTMLLSNASVTPDLVVVGNAALLAASVDIMAVNGASPDSVTVDYSAFDGGSVVAMTDGGSGTWTDSSFTVSDTQAAGSYTVTITATDSVNSLTETEQLVVKVGNELAFANSDMEADMHNTSYGLKPTTSGYESVVGHDGTTSRALHVYGTNTSTAFIFTSAVPLNAQGTYTKISFWVKGAITGVDKTLSIQVGGVGSNAPGQLFPCGVIGASDKTVVSASGHSYIGSLNTEGNWVKITLDLITGTATTTAGNTIAFKVGGATGLTCDFYIDDIVYEE